MALGAPTGLSASVVNGGRIDLSWTDNSTTELGHKIERSPNGSSGWTQIATVGPNVTSYSATGLTAYTIYYFRVRAYDAGADSSYSSTVSGVPTPLSLNAPSSATATAISATQIDLAWVDNTHGEFNQTIQRSLSSSSGFSTIATVAADVQAYSDTTGLSPGTTYYYRIKADDGPYSNKPSATTTAFAAPSGLTATMVSGTAIDLAWTDNTSTEDNFKVERSLDGSTGWTEIATPAANATTYSDTGLTPGVTYYYRVRAYDAPTNSAYSNTANATTPATLVAPTSLAATAISASQINLTWTDTSTGEDGTRIERSLTGSSGWSEVGTVGAGVTAYSDTTGLSPITAYYYRARAYDGLTNGSYSSNATATTLASVTAPTSLVANPLSSTEIDLSWVDNAVGEDGFKVERSLTGSGSWSQIGTAAADATTYSDTGLTVDTTYYYRVRAYSGATNGSYSSNASATTTASLAAPTGLTATTISATQINLAWTDNSVGEDGTKVERSPDGVSSWTEIATPGPNVTTYSNTGLTGATAYYYRVRAYDGATNSAYSSTANATTSAVLAAPSSLVATGDGATTINLTWTNNSAGEDGTKIEYGINGSSYSQIAIAPPGAVGYAITGLLSNQGYYFRVRAYSGSTHTSYSTAAFGTTGFNTPTSLIATGVSSTRIDLSWTDNALGEYAYKVERSNNPSSGFVQIGTTNPIGSSTTYADEGLTPSTTYYYRVRAYDEDVHSAYSNVATGATTLVAPSSLTATTISATQIDLAWTDNSTGETGFRIERSPSGTSWTIIATTAANATSYSDTSVLPLLTYYYRVSAVGSTGVSSPSNMAADSTPAALYAPSDVRVDAISTTALRISWTNTSIGQDGTKIERSLDGSTGWTEVGTAAGSATSYDNTGLSTTTTYYYRVRSYYDSGNSDYSEVVPGRTGLIAPNGLDVSENSSTENALTWVDLSTGEDGFKVERSADGVTGWSQIGTNTAGDVTYTDTGLTADAGYFYRVRAYYSTINSAYSAPASASVVALLETPGNLTASVISANRIDLSWLDTNVGEEGTKIERSPNGSSGWTVLASVAAEVTTYSDTAAVANTTHYYRVRAFSGTTYSPYAGPVSVNTGLALLQPFVTVYALGPDTIQMYWTQPNADESGYQIERSTSPASGFSLIATNDPDETFYTDTGLTIDTAYYYRVRSVHGGIAYSPWSEVAGATTGIILAAPANLFAQPDYPPGTLSVYLGWTEIAGGEDGYKIERSPAGAGTWSTIATVATPNLLAYRDASGLAVGNSYDYRVRAYEGVNNGPYSAIVTASIVDLTAGPSSLTATAIGWNRIDLAWTDNSAGQGYPMVQRSLNGTAWVDYYSLAAGSNTFSDTATAGTTTYYYRVYYQNAPLPIDYSNTASATTFAFLYPPTNVRAVASGAGTLALFWDNWNIGVTGHQNTKVERSANGVDGWTQIAVLDPAWTIYNDTGLASVTTYYYRVRFNYGTYTGHSAYSEVFSGITDSVLATPSNFTAVQAGNPGSSSSFLSWIDNSVGEDGFKIERSRSVLGPWVEIAQVGSTTQTNAPRSYFDTGLAGAGNYFYRIRAYKGGAHSDYTVASMEMVLATPVLSAAAINAYQINLSWSDTNEGEDGYSVERSQNGTDWTVIGSTTENNLTFADAPLLASTLYYYRVRAYSGTLYSSYSNTASTTTDIARLDTRRGDRLRTRRIHDLVAEPQTGYVLNPERSFFSVIVPEETVNLVTDPEMRSGVGWSAVGGATITRQSEIQRRGIFAYSAYGAYAGAGIRYTLQAPLAVNQPYTFSCDLKGSGTYTLYFSTAGGSVIGRTEVVLGTSFWQRVSLSSYITSAQVQAVSIVANEPQTTFYVDGFQVENLDHPTTFVSGAMRNASEPGYAWLGTPHRSMSYRGLDTSGGRVTPLSDLGFEVMEFLELGYAEQTSIFEDYALLPGSFYHGTRSGLRTFTLVGDVSADSFVSLMRKRFSIGDRIQGGDDHARPITLVFQAYDCGEPMSEELQIRAVYKSGLGGSINNLYQERIAITFESGDPLLSSFGNRGAAISLTEPIELTGSMVAVNDDGYVVGLPPYECGGSGARPPQPVVGSDNNLYQACGNVISAWNGYNWSVAYRSQVGDIIVALEIGPDGRLYFAVNRTINHFHVYAYDIATGTVDNLNNTRILGSNASNQPVNVIRRHKNTLIFGGRITSVINDVSGHVDGLFNIARYDPRTGGWLRMTTGVGLDVTYDNHIEDIAVDGRDFVWVGGHFRNDAVDDIDTVKDLAVYINGAWCNTGYWTAYEGDGASQINAIAIHQPTNTVYVAGHFEEVQCQFGGSIFDDLANIVAIPPSNMIAHTSSPYFVPTDNTSLLVSVTKLRVGPTFRVAPAPVDFYSDVKGLAVSCNHRVAVVGSFDSVGNDSQPFTGLLPAPGVAIWDGNAKRWEPSPFDLLPFDIGAGFFYYRTWSVGYGGKCSSADTANGTGLGVLQPAFSPSTFGLGTQPGYSNSFFFNADNAESGTTTSINILTNETGVAVRPEIEITGPGELLAIRNYTTERSITFKDLFVFAGETITIRMNLDDFGVFSSSRGNITHMVVPSSSYPDFPLIKGENEIVVRMTQTTTATAVYFRWPVRYASIDAFTQMGGV